MIRRGLSSLEELKKEDQKEVERKERTRCERESAVSVEGSSASGEMVSPRQLSGALPDSFQEALGSGGEIAGPSTSTSLGVQQVPIYFRRYRSPFI